MASIDDEVLTRLHEQHRARLERIITNRLRDPEAAADVVSEAFIRLQAKIADGWAPDDAAAWLTRVALNLAASEGRHRQVVSRAAPRLAQPRQAEPLEDEVLGRDALAQVARALAGLSRQDQSLVLEAAGGATGAMLGVSHGCSAGDARVRLHRARRRLRDAVAATA
jgi:RNA polymerase sigma-70 factor (ECF subfamily)